MPIIVHSVEMLRVRDDSMAVARPPWIIVQDVSSRALYRMSTQEARQLKAQLSTAIRTAEGLQKEFIAE